MKHVEYLGETERLSREILAECFKVPPPVFSYAKIEKPLFGKERRNKYEGG